jgi:putative PIN family toxin of toxin-antitoxin system
MSRLVLDTNVLVSASIASGGNENKVLRLALSAEHQLYVSAPIVEEYRRILYKPKFDFPPSVLEALFALIKQQATVVSPAHRLSISTDEADNRFLECAETASADYLITGNKKHFPARWKKTSIVNAREWLEATISF